MLKHMTYLLFILSLGRRIFMYLSYHVMYIVWAIHTLSIIHSICNNLGCFDSVVSVFQVQIICFKPRRPQIFMAQTTLLHYEAPCEFLLLVYGF